MGAEPLLAAEKGKRQIAAVKVKSFVGASEMDDLEKAIGQYAVYRAVLAEREPERELYLAVSEDILKDIFDEPLGKLLLENDLAQVIGFNPKTEVIVRWIP
ncbi:MAG: fatty-acid synthase [Leptolyngbyaceae cyanobacterium RM2_2_4]|nr:fatty-acid synthase [Leptolyngbyaceae cyanobacterium SM1_4_3]NJO52927.1 fatty-acid synthase [Leptolyngbyaceae cyanobacterium RM2_2_4]